MLNALECVSVSFWACAVEKSDVIATKRKTNVLFISYSELVFLPLLSEHSGAPLAFLLR